MLTAAAPPLAAHPLACRPPGNFKAKFSAGENYLFLILELDEDTYLQQHGHASTISIQISSFTPAELCVEVFHTIACVLSLNMMAVLISHVTPAPMPARPTGTVSCCGTNSPTTSILTNSSSDLVPAIHLLHDISDEPSNVSSQWGNNKIMAKTPHSRHEGTEAISRIGGSLQSDWDEDNLGNMEIEKGTNDLRMLSLEEALDHLEQMFKQPSVEEIIDIMQKCRRIRSLQYAKRLHLYICSNGLEVQATLGNHIVPMFVQCGSMYDAQRAFDVLVYRNEHSWTSNILGYIEHEQPVYSLSMYQEMRKYNVYPSSYTLVAVLRACIRTRDLERGRKIHIEIVRRGFDRNPFVGSTVINMYSKCCSPGEARESFDKLSVRNVVTWNALISGYVENGDGQEALRCFQRMQLEGMSPDTTTFICSLKACGMLRTTDSGRAIHRKATEKGLDKDIFVANTIIDMYAKCGAMYEAREVFDKLVARNVVSWNVLIAGYSENAAGEALKCFEQMILEGMPADVITFICTLKVCASTGNIDKGREIHHNIKGKRFERDLFLGNTLVDMYAKCGALTDAQQVFDELRVRDVVSWSVLIGGYAENGHGEESLRIFERMQLEGPPPDSATFVCCLKACSSLGIVEKGREIHSIILQNHFEKDTLVGTSLIDMYAKCGSMMEAQEVFDRLPIRNVISWTSLIEGYAGNGLSHEALRCLEQMQVEYICPNAVTFLCSLKACCSIGAICTARKIHAQVVQTGLLENLSIGNCLVGIYAKHGYLAEAHEVFDRQEAKDVVSWTALISGYAENGLGEEALKCFREMLLHDVSPDAITFLSCLKACGDVGSVDSAREIHARVIQLGFQEEALLVGSLVDMYARCGLLADARNVFDRLSYQNIASWNALIAGFIENGHNQQALNCFAQIQVQGVLPDAITLVCSLKACGNLKNVDQGRKIHDEIVCKKFKDNVFVNNALISMYAKCGLLVEAQKVFDKLPIRDVVSWNALIEGYSGNGCGQEALKCLEAMQLEGMSPDVVTLVSSLKACSNVGSIEKGREIHIDIVRRGYGNDPFVGSTLIDMYAKCASVGEAQTIFNNLAIQNVISWNAMIRAFSMNDECTMAVQCFHKMLEEGIMPNGVTFTCLLTACSRSNFVVKGQEYFKVMTEEYNIAPTTDHYTCLVDILARSGRLHEAEKLLKLLSPSEEKWTAFLGSCKTYGETELGIRCFDQLVHLNPQNASSYVLMANIYASEGGWEEANKILELKQRAGAKKKPAIAMIEVNSQVHQFEIGDKQTSELKQMLETLNLSMKDEGYIPNLELVLKRITDEKKEVTLCGHVERMAMAFGLLHTPQGHTLRVTKNLRMCNDCHCATKVISRTEKREITVREPNWVHHFKEGLCSCGDMW